MVIACERVAVVVAEVERLWRAFGWSCGGRRGGGAHKNSCRDGCAKLSNARTRLCPSLKIILVALKLVCISSVLHEPQNTHVKAANDDALEIKHCIRISYIDCISVNRVKPNTSRSSRLLNALHRQCESQPNTLHLPHHLLFLSSRSFSLGSPMPSSLMANKQSLSGRHGLS